MTFPFERAADENRTRDLHITNVTLYRLSHSSLVFQTTHLYYHDEFILSTDFYSFSSGFFAQVSFSFIK